MALSGKFNDKVLEAAEDGQEFNPFAANVHLSGPNAVKLAALEEREGSGLIKRVTGGEGGPYGDRRDRKSREEEARARMLALAQAWDAQLVTVGGVSMTNAQAQAARRRILENPEYYAEWAKRQGLINEGEEKQFIDAARRMTELKDRERIGQLTPAQRQEMQDLQGSRLGRAVDQATGQAHRETQYELDQKAHAPTSVEAPAQADAIVDRIAETKSKQLPKAPGNSADDLLFASAPSLKAGFTAGLKATEPLERPRTQPAVNETPRQPDRTAAASGLDL